jgi:hypothetical protein
MELISGPDTNMSDVTELTPIIARGIALHKMIRSVPITFHLPKYLIKLLAVSLHTPSAEKDISILKATSLAILRYSKRI